MDERQNTKSRLKGKIKGTPLGKASFFSIIHHQELYIKQCQNSIMPWEK